MKCSLLAAAGCCGDESGPVPTLGEIGYLGSSSAAPADHSVLGVARCESAGTCCCCFYIPQILVLYI